MKHLGAEYGTEGHAAIHRYKVDTKLGWISLASDEAFVSIEAYDVVLPDVSEPPLDVLMRMAGVSEAESLGRNGPVVASAVNPENDGKPELRRYEAKFGRDAFYTAEFLARTHPQLEDGTVRYFAAYQATRTDPAHQSAPGKIPNHIRRPDDPLALQLTRESGRKWPWFGGTDTTVQFISAVCRMIDRYPECLAEVVVHPADHGAAGQPVLRKERPQTLGRAAVDAATWLLRELRGPPWSSLLWVPMNRKDSFTVWTDSPNFFSFRDGRLAPPPVAPVQLQAQVYDALLALGALADRHPALGLDPFRLRDEAARIRQLVLDRFVVTDDKGAFLASAVARDASGTLVPLAVRTTNMGLVLDSGLLDGDDVRSLREALVRQVFSAEMSSVYGMVGRTRDHVRFEKFDYHSQVWGFAVHKVARGLLRHGYHALSNELDARVMQQTTDGLFPENVGAGATPMLEYCQHILRVSRLAADGRPTVTVKERPPAPFAAWTVGAVLEIEASSRTDRQAPDHRLRTFDEAVLASANVRAYNDPRDLVWRPARGA